MPVGCLSILKLVAKPGLDRKFSPSSAILAAASPVTSSITTGKDCGRIWTPKLILFRVSSNK